MKSEELKKNVRLGHLTRPNTDNLIDSSYKLNSRKQEAKGFRIIICKKNLDRSYAKKLKRPSAKFGRHKT